MVSESIPGQLCWGNCRNMAARYTAPVTKQSIFPFTERSLHQQKKCPAALWHMPLTLCNLPRYEIYVHSHLPFAAVFWDSLHPPPSEHLEMRTVQHWIKEHHKISNMVRSAYIPVCMSQHTYHNLQI